MTAIDLNADLGESLGAWRMGDDESMLDVVTSASIACGFHAGDPSVMVRTVRMAASRGVRIGAHVAYPDLVGFGRRAMDIEAADLTAIVLYQIGALDGICRSVGTSVSYVKPHGALYSRMGYDEGQAAAVVEAVARYRGGSNAEPLALMGPPGSAALRIAAERGLRTVREAFADRAYRDDGTLVPRTEPGAVLHDPAVVAARVTQLVTTGALPSVSGAPVPVAAQSICVHGDTAGAVQIAQAVRAALVQAGVAIGPVAASR